MLVLVAAGEAPEEAEATGTGEHGDEACFI